MPNLFRHLTGQAARIKLTNLLTGMNTWHTFGLWGLAPSSCRIYFGIQQTGSQYKGNPPCLLE